MKLSLARAQRYRERAEEIRAIAKDETLPREARRALFSVVEEYKGHAKRIEILAMGDSS